MAQPSYITLGTRFMAGIDRLRAVVVNSPPIQWSRGVLRRAGLTGRTVVIAVPWIWLLLFFLVPFFIVLKISFAETRWLGTPPYTPLVEWVEGHYLQIKVTVGNYLFLFKDALYAEAFLSSLKVAFVSTIFCLLIGYPMAYGIARANANSRNTLLLLVILPFWTSFLLRVYAWIGLLGQNGVINQILLGLGIVKEPVVMLQTDFAMYIGIVYSYLPFMILPLYSNLEKHDNTLLEAAVDLGCRPFKAFLAITLPLSMPGIIAGSMLVFIPAVGEFVIPRLLGGTDSLMIGRVLWDEYFSNRNWPVASAVAIALLLVLVVPIMIFQRYQAQEAGGVVRR
ncbi:MAG TPA: ABC transporter permease subunit [Steroidobacteraceae bacterium]|nr:ABC transporter permease subunit [Steroidobacteraceae bacterium]